MTSAPPGQTFKRDMIRLGTVGGVLVLAFISVSFYFARQASLRHAAECDALFRPLVAEGASPATVSARVGTSGESFPRGQEAALSHRLSAFGPGPQSATKIQDALARSDSAQLYVPPSFQVYVAFYDPAARLREYVCFDYTTD